MSLINDMLRDLDQRNAATREPAVVLPRVAQPLPPRTGSRVVLLVVAALAVAVVLAGAGWFFFAQQKASSAVKDSALVASGAVPAPPGLSTAEAAPDQATAPVPVVQASGEPASPETASADLLPIEPAVAEPVPVQSRAEAASLVSEAVPPTPEFAIADTQTGEHAQAVTQTAAQPMASAADPVTEPVSPQVSVHETVYDSAQENVQESFQEPLQEQPSELFTSTAFATTSMPETAQPQSFAPVRPMEKTPVLSAVQRDQQAVDQATVLWERGQALDAENLLRLQLAQDARAERSRALLAQLLMASGRLTETEGVLATVDASASADLRKLKARLLQGLGQPQAALALLRERVPAVKEDADYHVVMAALFSQLGLFDDAVNSYAGLVSFNGNNADWWAGLGIALEGDGQLEPARRAYRQATSLSGLHPQLQDYVIPRLQALQR